MVFCFVQMKKLMESIDLPQPNVGPFYSLTQLQGQGQSGFGFPSIVYKAVSENDGRTYCLRRFPG